MNPFSGESMVVINLLTFAGGCIAGYWIVYWDVSRRARRRKIESRKPPPPRPLPAGELAQVVGDYLEFRQNHPADDTVTFRIDRACSAAFARWERGNLVALETATQLWAVAMLQGSPESMTTTAELVAATGELTDSAIAGNPALWASSKSNGDGVSLSELWEGRDVV